MKITMRKKNSKIDKRKGKKFYDKTTINCTTNYEAFCFIFAFFDCFIANTQSRTSEGEKKIYEMYIHNMGFHKSFYSVFEKKMINALVELITLRHSFTV